MVHNAYSTRSTSIQVERAHISTLIYSKSFLKTLKRLMETCRSSNSNTQ